MKPAVDFEIGFPGEAWLKGVTAAANKLIEMGVADSARLGVHGTSYGGYATNLLVTQTDRFKAAINISGKVDIISFYTDSPRLGVRNITAAERQQDRIGVDAVAAAAEVRSALGDLVRRSHQDADAADHGRAGFERAGGQRARDVLRAPAAREGSDVGELHERRARRRQRHAPTISSTCTSGWSSSTTRS